MRTRLPLVLSTAALVVAVFGSTSFGRAAIDAAVPLAKRAYLADTAKNAIRVNNIKASRTPTPGRLLPLDANGKLPESIGAVGPKGDKGDKGEQGGNGATKVVVRVDSGTVASGSDTTRIAACNTGERAVGGGHYTSGNQLNVYTSFPSTSGGAGVLAGQAPGGWTVYAHNPTASPITVTALVVCSSP